MFGQLMVEVFFVGNHELSFIIIYAFKFDVHAQKFELLKSTHHAVRMCVNYYTLPPSQSTVGSMIGVWLRDNCR